MKLKKFIFCFLIVIAFPGAMNSVAQQRQNEIKPDQYRAVQWTREEGLSFDNTNTMYKDVNGFLWIGSGSGSDNDLCRFDGAVFKKYIPDALKRGSINSGDITTFKEDSLHNIWIGTAKGLSRYDIKADTFTNFSPFIDSALLNLRMAPFWATKDEMYCMEPGSLITAFNIHTLKRRKLLQLPKEVEMGIHWNTNKSFFDAGSNSVWKLSYYGQQRTVLEQIFLDNGKTQDYPWPCYRNNVDHRHNAEDIEYDSKRNSIWINSGDGLLEFSLQNKQFHHIDALNDFVKLKEYDRYVGMTIDKHGRIWLATEPKGILIYDPQTDQLQQLFSDPELQTKTSENNLHIYCDRDGIVWTSNYGGKGIYELLPFNPLVKRYTANPNRKDSLSSGWISTIFTGPHGKLWIGTADGLNIFDPGTETFEVMRENDLPGIRGTAIIPLYIDTLAQKAWLSAGSQETVEQYFSMTMYEMDIKTRRCRRIVFMNGSKPIDTFSIPHTLVRPYKKGIIFCDEKHGVFEIKEGSLVANLLIPLISGFGGIAMAEERQMFLQSGGAIPNFTFENKNEKWIKISHLLDSLNWSYILYNKKDSTYWVSLKKELIHFAKDFRAIKTYTEKDGYNGLIVGMEMDNDGNIWFVNFSKQLGRFDPVTGIITNLSEKDGYHKQDYDWYVPATKDVSGNLYFGIGWKTGTGEFHWGLDRIYPERYFSANTASVYLETLTINQKPFPLSLGVNSLEELSLHYDQNTLRIETGIIDYYSRVKGHIRYKLERNGLEGDWLNPQDNIIRYEDLQPGSYRLVLQASNASNEFTGPERILFIHISPPFWETWWFRTLVIAFLLASFYGIYRWRTATLRRQKRKLEQTVKERTAEVVEEKAEVERQKEKSDELLLNILPSEVANELKEKGYTTAKSFDEVTVLFSDIKGFTNVAEKLSAQELVKEINTYFSAFDNIILKYGLEKIKTIGDAYIAAGGLPEKNSATAQNVIEAAIAMQQIIHQLKEERILLNKPYFELRIGIHTGPVVAGVVGIKKFQYDIWGDTVNLAARMEQSGVPGKINISQQTYELVKEQFNCVHRGKIEAKNKGQIDMYFVE